MPIDTKQMISDHLTSLLMKKNLEDITVKCLVEDCRISRQTFYYHFQDLTDVIQWKIHQRIQQSLQDSLKAASLKEAIRIFVSGAEENRKLLKSFWTVPGGLRWKDSLFRPSTPISGNFSAIDFPALPLQERIWTPFSASAPME